MHSWIDLALYAFADFRFITAPLEDALAESFEQIMRSEIVNGGVAADVLEVPSLITKLVEEDPLTSVDAVSSKVDSQVTSNFCNRRKILLILSRRFRPRHLQHLASDRELLGPTFGLANRSLDPRMVERTLTVSIEFRLEEGRLGVHVGADSRRRPRWSPRKLKRRSNRFGSLKVEFEAHCL